MQAENAAGIIFNAVAKEAPMIAQAKEATKKGSRYVVDMSEGMINSIDHSVHSVLLGQQNDRIGLYYSGLALYLEAKT